MLAELSPLATITTSVVAGGAIVIVGAYLARSHDHARWLREQRLQLYADFADASQTVYDAVGMMRVMRHDPGEHDLYLHARDTAEAQEIVMGRLLNRIRMIGSLEMATLSGVMVMECRELIGDLSKMNPDTEFFRDDVVDRYISAANTDLHAVGRRERIVSWLEWIPWNLRERKRSRRAERAHRASVVAAAKRPVQPPKT